jgi:branched-chain amino acid transport system substrate-binding protein
MPLIMAAAIELTETKTERRDFLKVIGAGVGGLVVGGLVGSAITPKETVVTQGATTQTVTSTVTQPSKVSEPVRIGVPTFLSGPFVSSGEHVVNASKMAIDDVKAAGWLGREIELYPADTGAVTPDEVKRAFERLIDVNKTHFNVATWGTYGPGWDVTLKSGIPLITGDTALGVTDAVAAHPETRLLLTWEPLGSGRQHECALNCIEWLIEQGLWKPRNDPRTIYVVYSDFVWDADWAKVLRPMAEGRGWKIVGYDLVPMGTLDWTAVISKIRASDPDVVFHCDLSPADAGTFASTFSGRPSKSLLINTSGFLAPESLQVTDPKTLVGVIHNFGATPLHILGRLPIYLDWKKRYTERFGIEPNLDASHIYDSIIFALKAVRTAGTTEPAALYDAFFETIYYGLEGRWAFERETKMVFNYPKLIADSALQIQEIEGEVSALPVIYPPEVAWVKFQLPTWFG